MAAISAVPHHLAHFSRTATALGAAFRNKCFATSRDETPRLFSALKGTEASCLQLCNATGIVNDDTGGSASGRDTMRAPDRGILRLSVVDSPQCNGNCTSRCAATVPNIDTSTSDTSK